MEKHDWVIHWNKSLISGNKILDTCHKAIIDGINELYAMCEDTKKYEDQLPESTAKVEKSLLDHIDIEDELLKKYNIPNYQDHIADHEDYKIKLNLYKQYFIPPTIRAILVAEFAREYMKDHFFKFDSYDIPLINKEIQKEKNEK